MGIYSQSLPGRKTKKTPFWAGFIRYFPQSAQIEVITDKITHFRPYFAPIFALILHSGVQARILPFCTRMWLPKNHANSGYPPPYPQVIHRQSEVIHRLIHIAYNQRVFDRSYPHSIHMVMHSSIRWELCTQIVGIRWEKWEEGGQGACTSLQRWVSYPLVAEPSCMAL
jgi:hypothetical protein